MMEYPSFFFPRKGRVVPAEEQAERRRLEALNHNHRMKHIEAHEPRHKTETQRVEADDEYRRAYKEFISRRQMKEEKERRGQQQSRQEQQYRSHRNSGPRYVADEQDVSSADLVNYKLGRYERSNSKPLPSHRTPSTILNINDGRLTQIRAGRPVRIPTYIGPHGTNKKIMHTDEMGKDGDVVHELPQPVVRAGDNVSQTQLKRNINGSTKAQKKTKKRVTVIVEDVSDNEYDDELDSPARNRRPSPGQWMEPVEGFHA